MNRLITILILGLPFFAFGQIRPGYVNENDPIYVADSASLKNIGDSLAYYIKLSDSLDIFATQYGIDTLTESVYDSIYDLRSSMGTGYSLADSVPLIQFDSIDIKSGGSYKQGGIDLIRVPESSSTSLCVGNSGNQTFSGSRNYLLGEKAGYSISSATDNMFIGYESGYNTTGGYNFFMGYSAGKNVSTGLYNVAMGYNSMGQGVTTGNSNFCSGYATGYKLTSGRENLFLSAYAGYNMSTGSYNVSIGANALFSATNSVNNVAIGNYNSFRLTSGSDNSSIGKYGLFNTTTGVSNLTMGLNSGYNNTIGNYNIYLGGTSGYTNITGSNNVFIGNSAGYLNTGTGSVFIGYCAGYSETASNKIYIDNSNTGTPLIGGDLSNNYIGINTAVSSVSANLHITSGAHAGSSKLMLLEDDLGTDLLTINDIGQIGINTASPNASAIIDITSTTRGVLLPRMTAAQAVAISAVNGLILYVIDTDATFTSPGFWGYEAGAWIKL